MINQVQMNDFLAVQTEVAAWMEMHRDELFECPNTHLLMREKHCQDHQDYLRHAYTSGEIRAEFALCKECPRFSRRALADEETKPIGYGRRLTKKGKAVMMKHGKRMNSIKRGKTQGTRDQAWLRRWRERRAEKVEA